MGPEGFQESLVYLRTAVSVDPKGWAKFDYVKMPEYRWGILLAPRRGGPQDSIRHTTRASRPGRRCRANTAPCCAGWSSSRATPSRPRSSSSAISARPRPRSTTCATCSRSTSRRAATCGRWSTCCRNISAATAARRPSELLQRRSGDADKPRMLGAFNEATPDWLSFFMFTFFTDRDGKMQLESLAQSGFDPLSRTCRFMLTEEAHHMFVGETGIGRTVAAHLRGDEGGRHRGPQRHRGGARARRHRPADHAEEAQPALLAVARPVRLGGVDQRRQLLQLPASRAASRRRKIEDDHRLENATYPVLKLVDGEIKRVDEPALTAINMRLRDDYIADCQRGLERWNKIIEKTGVELQARAAARRLPSPDRRVQGRQGDAGRQDRRRRDVGARQGQVAAVEGRRRLHRRA